MRVVLNCRSSMTDHGSGQAHLAPRALEDGRRRLARLGCGGPATAARRGRGLRAVVRARSFAAPANVCACQNAYRCMPAVPRRPDRVHDRRSSVVRKALARAEAVEAVCAGPLRGLRADRVRDRPFRRACHHHRCDVLLPLLSLLLLVVFLTKHPLERRCPFCLRVRPCCPAILALSSLLLSPLRLGVVVAVLDRRRGHNDARGPLAIGGDGAGDPAERRPKAHPRRRRQRQRRAGADPPPPPRFQRRRHDGPRGQDRYITVLFK